MKKSLVLFRSTRDAIKAERLCTEYRIYCRIIPVPRDISSECGMAMEINQESTARLAELFKGDGIAAQFCER